MSRDLVFPDFDAASHGAENPPLVHFAVPQTFVIFDAKERHLTLLVNAFGHGGCDARTAYGDAKQILEGHIARICAPPTHQLSPLFSQVLPERTTDEPDNGFTDQAQSLTDAAKSCRVSALYLSKSLSCQTSADPLSVYRVFRMVYPSAYCYLFRINGSYYIGSHEQADAPHSLSFANLLRHVLRDTRFVGVPSEQAGELRREKGMRYRHDSAVFGYVGFNGRYKLTHGNKEVVIKHSGSGYEALFSKAASAVWTGIYSAARPTVAVTNAGSASATIRRILSAAEQLK